ncbi:hypothetical protein V8C34DRAFT_312068 [Trichoderma compactum]
MNISYKQAVPSESLESNAKREIEDKQEDNERDSQAAAGSKTSLFFSSRALEWVVHLLAVSISIIGICWLRYLSVYWTDKSTWTTSWAWAFLDLDGILKALQFITKVHMLLMITSIANITVNFSRCRLVGHRGIAFDNFWYTVNFITKDSATISLSIFILCSAILCQLVGLASIGVIQPNLGWWYSKKNETFPVTLNSTTMPTTSSTAGLEWDMDSCLTALPQTSALACPGYGFEANYTLPNLTMVGSITGAERILAAESIGNGTAIAATQLNWVIRLYAIFVRYIQLHHLGVVNPISNPMYTSADPIYAPVVQVQCHVIDSASANHSSVSFLTNKLTNYTEAGAIWYESKTSWIIPNQTWNFSNDRHGSVNFSWVDLSSKNALERREDEQTTKLDTTWRPSTGAVAAISGVLGDQPTSYIVTCIVDARWAASSAWYEPTMSEMVVSNLSNPSVLTQSTFALNLDGFVLNEAKSSQPWGIGDPIHISPHWAELLNTPGHPVDPSITATSIKAMLYNYITRLDGANYAVFAMASSDGGFVTDSADLMEEAADKVATILSLAIADGLSRITNWSESLAVLDINGDNITYSRIRLRVQRYGWAYGWSTITMFSIVVLLIHISMAVWYAVYEIRRIGDSIELVAGKKYI